MQIPQLTNYILEELERGTSELEIKQKLFQSHWMPEDIEENYQYALAEAQQLLSQYADKKVKTSRSKGQRTIAIAGVCVIIAIVISVGYFFYIVYQTYTRDSAKALTPFGEASIAPTPLVSEAPIVAIVDPFDRSRENDRKLIQAALIQYYEGTNRYPPRLSDLTPSYLSSVPRDPQTSNPYKYEALTDGQDYKLCIPFAEVGELCFNRLSQ